MHALNLKVPDTLYVEIAQAAAVRGLSVESVVIDRLAAEFSDDPTREFLNPGASRQPRRR